MKKIIVRLFVLLIVLLVLGVICGVLFLDTAVKKGVETIGPRITKVDVRLDEVNLSLLKGTCTLKGLVVGNPPDFQTPHAIGVGRTFVSLDPGSLLSDKIVVRSIQIESPEITFEGGLRGANLNKILDNVNGAPPDAGAKGAAAPPGQAPQSQKPGKKLQVDELVITGAKVHVSVVGLGGYSGTLPLPEIKLTNLGTDANGITAGDLTKKVLQELLNSSIKVALSAVTGQGKNAVNSALGAGKSATDSAGKAAKSLLDRLKNP